MYLSPVAHRIGVKFIQKTIRGKKVIPFKNPSFAISPPRGRQTSFNKVNFDFGLVLNEDHSVQQTVCPR
jgi:hypothetical protein